MPKVILHGGYTNTPAQSNKDFFAETSKDLPEGAQILVVYFSREEGEHDDLFKQDEKNFIDNANGKKLKIVLAKKENFIEQVKESDALYFRGGNTLQLLNTLNKYPDFKEVAKEKTLAGSSAGAYMLSACFYSKTEGGVLQGLGFVPVKTICHFEGKNEGKLNECPGGLETVLLGDYEMKVFNTK